MGVQDMLNNTLWEKDRYISPYYEWLISANIQEYDLEKANISILLDSGVITRKQYEYYANMPKRQREITVGCFLRDHPAVISLLQTGFMNARRGFLVENNISEENILYIDKDSITTINYDAKYSRISDNLNFRKKKVYHSFYRIFDIDLLYYHDGVNENYRLKNAPYTMMDRINSFKNGILDLILEISYRGRHDPFADTLRMINSAYRRYTASELCRDFYREFNRTAMYKIKNDSNVFDYYVDDLTDWQMSQVDISYNVNIFSLFSKIFSKQYFSSI